jgi:putative ABC transport system permease protein
MLLISREFILLVLVAFLLAAPVAYYAMNQWLGEFAYRIEMGAWVFVLSGVTAVVIAWATVSYQSFRAAVSDPVKALRTE